MSAFRGSEPSKVLLSLNHLVTKMGQNIPHHRNSWVLCKRRPYQSPTQDFVETTHRIETSSNGRMSCSTTRTANTYSKPQPCQNSSPGTNGKELETFKQTGPTGFPLPEALHRGLRNVVISLDAHGTGFLKTFC